MAETEMLYSARQVTESLDMTAQMAGRYFQAFEKITKTKIPKRGRDGRQFDRATRDVLVSARDIVRSSNGVTVEDAVRRALGLSQMPLELPALATAAPLDLAALKAVLSEALRDEIATPLIAEIRVLRDEIAELRGRELEAHNPAPEIISPGGPAESIPEPSEETAKRQHGLLVRLAIRLESFLRQ